MSGAFVVKPITSELRAYPTCSSIGAITLLAIVEVYAFDCRRYRSLRYMYYKFIFGVEAWCTSRASNT